MRGATSSRRRGGAAAREAEARTLDDRVSQAIQRCVGACVRHSRRVATGVLLATAAILPWTLAHLGIDSDNLHLLSPRLPFVERYNEFVRLFPADVDPLYVLVDGPEAASTREAAKALTARLAAEPDRVREVHPIGSGPFFERYGLLYRSVDDLEDLTDQLARAQPFLSALQSDPRLSTLVGVLDRGLDEAVASGVDPSPFFDQIREATVQTFAPVPVAPSWADLLLAGSSFEPPLRQILVVDPVADFSSPFSAEKTMTAIREAAAALPGSPGVRVRITGDPALSVDEMHGLVRDVGISSLSSFALVLVLLLVALRSIRLVGASALTLAIGLVWTAAFAAVSVGKLNLVSITFAVMFIGLGIDFSIHMLLHYGEERALAHRAAAWAATARRVGVSLVLCAVTTAIGFYAFLPTGYRGVAELGLIAGTGILLILALTFTWLPAVVGARPFVRERARGFRWTVVSRLGRITPRPRVVCAVFLALGAASLAAVPRIRFDSDVVAMRDPRSESVQAFRDLVAEGGSASPWQIDLVEPDLESAQRTAARLRELPSVGKALTLADFVPADQEEKREILADASLFLEPPPAGKAVAAKAPPTGAETLAALHRLDDAVARALPRASGRLAQSMGRLRAALAVFFERAASDGDARPEAARLEGLLMGELTAQLDRLRTALDPGPVGIDDLPPELVTRMRASDGRERVQVLPRAGGGDEQAIAGFVDQVLAVAPRATGSAVNLIEFGRATATALEQALLAAFVAITALVWLLWRRTADVACALAPLGLAALLTVGAMSILGLSFNFANVIVLPLLLGVGVDSGIHLVHRWRTDRAAGLGGRTTERAILYSALTTIASFGTLAFSAHRGIASLGLLLAVGMLISLACNLLFLPALLALRGGTPSERSRLSG